MDTLNEKYNKSEGEEEEQLKQNKEESPCSKLKSVPIPQPLILKRRTSKSSINSEDHNNNKLNENYPTSPTNSMYGELYNTNRRSFLNDEYSSSPGSDYNDTPQHSTRSPPPPPLSTSSFSPRYSSPPAGSGGKYMVRSKRASWIDGSSSITPYDSTPTTPITQPSTSTQKVPSLIPPLGLPKPITVPTSSTLEDASLKSGSLSKLREDRQTQFQSSPKRENSLDSTTTPLSASSSTTEHSFNKNRKQSEDDTMESRIHERKTSVSSIMTDSSLASEEFHSPLSSPRTYII